LGAKGGGDPDPEMTEKFYSMFEDVCDYCLVENIVPLGLFNPTEEELKTFGIENYYNDKRHMYGFSGEIQDNDLCEQIFYLLQVSTNGNVYPCCVEQELNPDAFLMGNVTENRLFDIWNSDALKKIRINLAKGMIPNVCKDCSWRQCTNYSNLGKYSDVILKRLTGDIL